MKKLYTLLLMSFFALGLSYAQEPLFFSEYIEGGSNNKALEIYNPTGAAVSLADYQIFGTSNAADDWESFTPFADGASIGAGEVYVLAHGEAVAAVTDQADEIVTGIVYYNGDDARAIAYITATDTTIVDIIGDIGDPGSGWEVAGVSNATANHTLVRKPNVTTGTNDWATSAGTDAATSQWIVWDQDDFSNIGIAPALVTSISIAGDGGATAIDVDDATLQILATIAPTNATVQNPEWSVDNEALASIDSDGLLTAVSNGDVTVTASIPDGSGLSATLIISLSNQVDVTPVTGITVSGTGDVSTIATHMGTLQMLAAVEPGDASDPTVSWSVDDDSIAYISESGMLMAHSDGTVTVTASANDDSGISGTLDVTISGQLTGVQNLFFSEYIEGSSNNKALEVFNPTDMPVSLSRYQIAQASNGEGWKYFEDFAAGAYVPANGVYVVANPSSVSAILDVTDETMTYPTYFNGNDARGLVFVTAADTSYIDVIGEGSPNPGTGWEVAGVANATANHTLVRKSNVQMGNDDWAASAGTNTEDSEWIVYDQDDFAYIGAHTHLPLITSITLAGAGGATSIDTDKGTLQIEETILPAESADQDLEWAVDDANLASIDETGLLSAINDGAVTVTGTAKDGSGIFGTVAITISNQVSIVPVTSIVVTGTGDATAISDNGGSLQMLAVVTPGDATDGTYTWSADDDAVATIDANGLLSAVNNGTVNVTATANDGFGAAGTLEVTVSEQFVAVADLTELRTKDATDQTTVYKVTGEVFLTFQQDYRGKKYVQDADAGVEIDDEFKAITTTYSFGDGITGLMGTLNDYYGHLQLKAVADPGAASSTGNTITPTVVTTTQILADHVPYQSMLIKLENVVFPEADGSLTFKNLDSYDLGDVNDTILCKVHFLDSGVDGTVVPDSANVTGIMVWDWGKARIAPRMAADIEGLNEILPSDDATITDLLVDAVSITGFTPAQVSYNVELASDYTGLPAVTAVTTDANAVVTVDGPVNLDGTEAERTSTVLITSEDGSATKSYYVIFNLAVGIQDLNGAEIGIYPVPAGDRLNIRSAVGLTEARVISITGATMKVRELHGEMNAQLDISDLDSGIYILKLSDGTDSAVLRFVKK